MTRNEQIKLIISAKDQASGVLNNLKKSVISIGAAYLTWRTAKEIIVGINRAGMESERVYNDLSASLIRHGEAWDKLRHDIYNYTASIQTATSYSDELVAQGLTKLINYGMKSAEAMRIMKVATDLSRGSNMDLLSATDLVGKAFVGYTATLSRYGIIVDENIPKSQKFAAAIEQIQKRFGGAAEAYMNTVSGQMDLLVERWGDVKEEIYNTTNAGALLYTTIVGFNAGLSKLPLIIQSGFNAFNSLFTMLKTWLSEASNNLLEFGKLLWTIFTGNIKDIVYQFDIFQIKLSNNIDDMFRSANDAIDAAIIYAANWSLAIASGVDSGILAYKKFFDLIKNPPLPNIVPKMENVKIIMEGYSDEYKNLVNSWMDYERQKMADSYYEWKKIQEQKLYEQQRLHDQMVNKSMDFVSSTIDLFKRGERDAAKIFAKMALDFIQFFVKRALNSLSGDFLGGLLGILGSIFDTRKNDLMAMTQGEHFAKYFTQGMSDYMAKANLGSRLAVPGVAMAGSPGGGGSNTVIQQSFYFQGMTDEQYVRRKVIPEIEKAVESGRSKISVKPDNITGARYVSLS